MISKDRITRNRWRTRRRMAITAFLYLLFIVPALFFAPEKLIDKVSSVAITVITLMGGIIMVYIGYATADDKWQKEDQNFHRGEDR